MTKVIVHHAVTGADYREKGRAGHAVTACTLPRDQVPRLDFSDPGSDGGIQVLLGQSVRRYGHHASITTYWAEAKVWPDDSPERCKLREDSRRGYCRAHVILWPSEEVANRLRDLVPFVDPITLDPMIRTAPNLSIVEDDPCPACNGTGTRQPQ